ncbi:MAG: tauC [Massilia sp.]|nr:tauC [Massilia sp.]
MAGRVESPRALNACAGFRAVPDTLRMAGRNYGIEGLPPALQILTPAALPAILSGLRIGWAFAWRTLIAAELWRWNIWCSRRCSG